MTKPRLLILSDLFGQSKNNWENTYIQHFQNDFEIKYYDCCELGNVDKTIYTQENLHQQFVNFGIEKAVDNLLKLEKERVTILAFSIGGTIAWKAALQGLKVNKLIALSATRLRYETEKPNGTIQLFYGKNDRFQPNQDWFKKMKIEPKIIKNTNHEFYKSYNPERVKYE
ncbi:MAG: alpha/beta hydrolase [Saprospiraceae bacterium]